MYVKRSLSCLSSVPGFESIFLLFSIIDDVADNSTSFVTYPFGLPSTLT